MTDDAKPVLAVEEWSALGETAFDPGKYECLRVAALALHAADDGKPWLTWEMIDAIRAFAGGDDQPEPPTYGPAAWLVRKAADRIAALIPPRDQPRRSKNALSCPDCGSTDGRGVEPANARHLPADRFIDGAGNLHLHDPAICVFVVTCPNGHRYVVTRTVPCPACDYDPLHSPNPAEKK